MKFIVGDFFKLTPKVAGMFEAAFDRGSLVCKDTLGKEERKKERK